MRLSKLIENWGRYERKGIDQDFLGEIIYPLVRDTSLEHSEFGLNFGGNTVSFPNERIDYEFVGDVFDENEIRHPDYWRLIKNK